MKTRELMVMSIIAVSLLVNCGNNKPSPSPTPESKYTITWKNDDGSKLLEEQYGQGETPSYKGETPKKDSTAQYDYTFLDWSPTIVPVTANATYVATYSQKIRSYEIEWQNDKGKTLRTDIVNYGDMPIYGKKDPTKPSTDEYDFRFAGWLPEVKEVTGPQIYKAQFTPVARTYDVTLNKTAGGSTSGQGSYKYNSKVTIKATPEDEYAFDGWYDKDNELVSNSATYEFDMPSNDVTLTANFYKAVIDFGKYPQSLITDTSITDVLSEKAGELPTPSDSKKWTSYDYYIGDGREPFKQKYMWYIDIDYEDDVYRGVYFDQYRPLATILHSQEKTGRQSSNGYKINTRYWFKYEPIKWRVLSYSKDNALIRSEKVLDSQQYYHYAADNAKRNRTDYQGNVGNDIYDNNYKYSDLRTFLNTSFYMTSFNDEEKEKIKEVNVQNDASTTASEDNKYACEDTKDKVFACSYKDIKDLKREERVLYTTEYAKCQGIDINMNDNTANWLLRSPCADSSNKSNHINDSGQIREYSCYATDYGILPALNIQLS